MPSHRQAIRNARIRLTIGTLSRIGLGLIATPIVVLMLHASNSDTTLWTTTWALLGLWWVAVGAYVYGLALMLVRHLDL